ncbi:MAG: segregation/condensation protein A [Acidobacteriota bacterium]
MEKMKDPQINETYRVKLEVFEGPLDLLLHLIRISRIDIYDIPIVRITEQYNAYLDLMKELNFDVAGEFLLMAATLIYIKSKMLLPSEVKEGLPEEEDPRAGLTRQLVDYQRYKAASENLTALEDIQSLIWHRSFAESVILEGEEYIEVSLFDLLSAFKHILEKMETQGKLELSREDYSVPEKMSAIMELLKMKKFLEFPLIFSRSASRAEVIATFLAILELIRLKMIRAFQRDTGDIIRIFSQEKDDQSEGEQN